MGSINQIINTSVQMYKKSPTAWDGVLPPHVPGLGGAPIHWEFEPGLGAFTSKAPGKPTRRFVRLTSGPSGESGNDAPGWFSFARRVGWAGGGSGAEARRRRR